MSRCCTFLYPSAQPASYGVRLAPIAAAACNVTSTRLPRPMLPMLLARPPTTATILLLAATRRSMPRKAVSTRTATHSYSTTSATTWQASPPGRPKIIIITGPTAVGKTKIGLELAKRLDGEIISADSVQVYKGLDIGSDKLPVAERQGIPHHLIDIFPPDTEFSAGDFHHLGRKAAEDIISRGKVPIVVGGTGFYLRWFIFGKAQTPPSNPQTAEQVKQLIQQAWAAAAAAAGGGGGGVAAAGGGVCDATAGQANGNRQQLLHKQQQSDELGQVEQPQRQAENGLEPDVQQQQQQQLELQKQQLAAQQQQQDHELQESDRQQQHLVLEQQNHVAESHQHHHHHHQQQQQQQDFVIQESNGQQQQQQDLALDQQDQLLSSDLFPTHHHRQQQQQQHHRNPASQQVTGSDPTGLPYNAPPAAAAAAAAAAAGCLSEDQQWNVAVDLVAQLGDPEAAERIRAERNNWYRLQRVLQILLQNGGKPLSQMDVDTTRPLDCDFRCFFLHRNRIELYDRICYRVEEMVSSGLLPEALMLLDMGLTPNSHIATKAIGYRQACEFMQTALNEGQATKQQLQQLILDIATASRNLVKSQTTWFRDDELFRWLEVGGRDAEDVLQDLLSQLDKPQHEGGCGDSGRLDKELQKALKRYVPTLRIFNDDAQCAEVLKWVSQAVASRQTGQLK